MLTQQQIPTHPIPYNQPYLKIIRSLPKQRKSGNQLKPDKRPRKKSMTDHAGYMFITTQPGISQTANI